MGGINEVTLRPLNLDTVKNTVFMMKVKVRSNGCTGAFGVQKTVPAAAPFKGAAKHASGSQRVVVMLVSGRWERAHTLTHVSPFLR